MITFLLGDYFGYLALLFIGITSVFMLARKKLLKYTKNLDLLRRTHIFVATMGGLFLLLHVAYFIAYPITSAVILGYAAGAVAVAVWLTGTAFLERFRDTLFYHGSLSLAAVGLMVIHAVSSGVNIPIQVAYIVLALTSSIILIRAYGHLGKMMQEVKSVTLKKQADQTKKQV